MIRFFSENNFKKFQVRKLSNWIKAVILKENKKTGELSIVFCDDGYLLEINKIHLNHDYYTDVITFDYCEGIKVSGDLFISTEMVHSNSERFSVDFNKELNRVIIHGVLHLLGYKDKTKEEKLEIRAKEDYYLSLCEN